MGSIQINVPEQARYNGRGGQGVVTADACASLGLEVPQLDAETVESLRKLLPPHAPRPISPSRSAELTDTSDPDDC